MINCKDISIEIVEVVSNNIHYILTATDENGGITHRADFVEVGEDIPVGVIVDEMLKPTSEAPAVNR